jgi:hypothetical protein
MLEAMTRVNRFMRVNHLDLHHLHDMPDAGQFGQPA